MNIIDIALAVFVVGICIWVYRQPNEETKSKQAYIDHYEKIIKNLKKEIEEIKNRPENWKNKITEAKETFKNE